MTERRFIEEHFPVKEVSRESSREKSIRHGHISTLHLWWARRPLAASRATIYASLIPAPEDGKDIESMKQEIAKLSRWENPISPDMIARARKRIMENNKDAPKVLDPFAGGGSIPLEALRLGCETYASDYNPVANMIVKATIEYPFAHSSKEGNGDELEPQAKPSLASDLKKWSQWVLKEARKELEQFFPESGGEPVGYLWSRCIPCQNPMCGATIPLLKQFWLANTKNKEITLVPSVDAGKISFKIVCDGEYGDRGDFDPSRGTVSGGKATCLACNHRMDGDRVKLLFAQNKNTERMNVVVSKIRNGTGKVYRTATKSDLAVFVRAQNALEKKRKALRQEYGVDPIPNEPLPAQGTLGFRVQRYGMKRWGDLFNDRQKLVLITFMEKILKASEMMQTDKDSMLALPYLGIILGRLVVKNATLCMWNTRGEKIEQVFGRQALPMIWDYVEVNPFTSVGWPNMEEWVLRVLEHMTFIDAKPATVRHASATALPFPDGFFDAVITDPPYYDNVPYSHLSDFFYVWMKRSIGDRFPELFSTPLTPKSNEIVAYSNVQGGGGARRRKRVLQEYVGAIIYRDAPRPQA